jgi:2C-methyl-D-erythritol 2,4-cyclodiphosphate synthase
VANVDATVIAEAPRVLPFVERMRSADRGGVVDRRPIRSGSRRPRTRAWASLAEGEGIAALAVATVSKAG